MKRTILTLLFLCAMAVVSPAQSIRGLIAGTVTDPSGAVINDVKVSIIDQNTNMRRQTNTDERGDFAIPNLDPGKYSLTVRAGGFKTLVRSSISLTASERLSVGTLVLELGTVDEQITVTAQGTAVQTISAERSSAITGSQMTQLLVRGRNATSLLGLLPGVVDPAVNQPDTPSPNNATSFDVLGNRTNANNITVDGLTFGQPGGAPHMGYALGMDSIAEVKVLLSNYQAEYGRMSGANIQVVTKSGARDFHGGASYFKRHEEFNANNFFNNRNSVAKPRYRYNTWAYNVGGPVYIPGKFNRNRDKLFFFWSHEYWPQQTTSPLSNITVPTALERAGDFSKSVDVNGALMTIVDPTTRQSFPGNVVPASRLDKNGQALLNFFPLPNFLDTAISKRAYNYVSQWVLPDPFQIMQLKLDYNISSKDSLSISAGTQIEHVGGPNLSSSLGVAFAALPDFLLNSVGQLLGTHEQHIFSPSLINEFTLGYVYRYSRAVLPADSLAKIQRDTYGFTAGQLNAIGNPLNLVPGLAFGGVTGAAGFSPDGRFPFHNARGILDLGDTVSKTIGSHMLKAGILAEWISQPEGPWANNFNGRFDFSRNVSNPLDSGNPYANAALGVFNTYQESTSRPDPSIYSRGLEWFLQDNWKVTRKLTLDYGVRFSWFEPFWQPDNRISAFVPAQFNSAQQVKLIWPALVNGQRVGQNPVTGAIYPAALIGAIAPGIGNPTNGMIVAADVPSYPRGLFYNPGIKPAPRLGFAYDPFGNGKTAIRGGFGMFYNRLLGYTSGTSSIQYPIVQTPVIQYGTINSFLSTQGYLTPPSIITYDPNMKLPMVMNMSLSIQRDIGFGTVVDVGYAGSLARHLGVQRNINEIPLGARFATQNIDPTNTKVPLQDAFLRSLTGYGDIQYRENSATSNYHSLQVTATRRFAKNLEFGANWTWSKAMDYSDADWGNLTTLVPIRVWNYGLAGFDRTHIVKANWLYDLPKFKTSFKPAQAVLNGWQMSGIASFVSGAPSGIGYSLVTPVEVTGTPSLSQRIVVTGNPVLPKSDRTFSQNFRTDVFQPAAVGTIGNAATTLVRGPGINNWDIGVFKTFHLGERVRAQFRAESYNTFNHTQFSTFDTTARFDANGKQVNAQLGQFTAARSPRQMQFALRLNS